MRITKVFNNNVVLAVDARGRELVLSGRGLGFKVAPGAEVESNRVEKTFIAGGSTSAERLAAFVDEIPMEDIEVTEEILAAAREALGLHVTDALLVPLADHVSFALQRARQGVAEIEYPLRWEVQHLYPAEAAFALEALRIIERRRGVRLPELEAVPVALHLVNAQFGSPDVGTTARMTEVLRDILDVVRAEFEIDIDEASVPVARFVTHLRYLFNRQGQGVRSPDVGALLIDAMRTTHPREHACAIRAADLLATRFGWDIGGEEVLYLALHVARLTADAFARESAAPGS